MVRGDVEELKTVVLTLGVCSSPIDHERLYEDIEGFLVRYGSMEIGSMDLGEIFEELMGLAKAHHISVPGGVSMLGRGVLTLEGVLAAISPDINLLQILANRVSASMAQGDRLESGASERSAVAAGYRQKKRLSPLSAIRFARPKQQGPAKMNVRLVDHRVPFIADGTDDQPQDSLRLCHRVVDRRLPYLSGRTDSGVGRRSGFVLDWIGRLPSAGSVGCVGYAQEPKGKAVTSRLAGFLNIEEAAPKTREWLLL